MKKTDIAMIIFIASISVLIAFFVGRSIPALSGGAGEAVKVKVAEPIRSEITDPDVTVFNKEAINPTNQVTIGGQSTLQEAP